MYLYLVIYLLATYKTLKNAKSQEPPYSQAFDKKDQNPVRQEDSYGGWCLELKRGVEKLQSLLDNFTIFVKLIGIIRV